MDALCSSILSFNPVIRMLDTATQPQASEADSSAHSAPQDQVTLGGPQDRAVKGSDLLSVVMGIGAPLLGEAIAPQAPKSGGGLDLGGLINAVLPTAISLLA